MFNPRTLPLAVLALCAAALMACQTTAPKPDPATPPAAETPVQTVDRKDAIASVNGVFIPRERLMYEVERFNMYRASTGTGAELTKEEIEKGIIDELINESLVEQHIRAAGVTVTEADVDAELEAFKARTDDFETFLMSSGATVRAIKDGLRTVELLKAHMKLNGQPIVQEEEIVAFFMIIQNQLSTPERVRGAHILVLLEEDADEAAQKIAQDKINAIHTRAAAGEDFAALAKTQSEGPSGPDGGDLGWFRRGMMVPAFETAAFALKAGEVSKPVRSKFGWHVIKVYEREEAKTATLEDARPEIVLHLEEQKAFKHRADLIDTLRPTAKIEIFTAP